MRPLHKLGENNSHTGSLETTHPATILRETEGMEIRNQLSPILSITLKDTVPWKQKATYKTTENPLVLERTGEREKLVHSVQSTERPILTTAPNCMVPGCQ